MMLGNYALHCIEMKLNSSVLSAELLFQQIFSKHSFGAQTVIYHTNSRTNLLIKKKNLISFHDLQAKKDTQFTGRSEGKKERNKVILGCFSRNS